MPKKLNGTGLSEQEIKWSERVERILNRLIEIGVADPFDTCDRGRGTVINFVWPLVDEYFTPEYEGQEFATGSKEQKRSREILDTVIPKTRGKLTIGDVIRGLDKRHFTSRSGQPKKSKKVKVETFRVYLGGEVKKNLLEISKKTGRTNSELIKEAIVFWLDSGASE